ncbi:transmembrane protein 213 [Callorhinchus milii]|uniref:transmembrane protein 213 n=1 Tax=Callorhinchus milii TaxID=7868 RepID=UPI0004573A7B|nr:transmembrane protein 213 [Callorhinchus milii]|eukprot:gi/632983263/ref/XP_007908560.1/ PREDICTED: transmembrane protein 213 [Callorhinchus milii]
MILRPACNMLAVAWLLICLRLDSACAEPVSVSDLQSTSTESSHRSQDLCQQYAENGLDMCTRAHFCCQSGMDENGWILAAIGWSLWFLTLILICANKVSKLKPEDREKQIPS